MYRMKRGAPNDPLLKYFDVCGVTAQQTTQSATANGAIQLHTRGPTGRDPPPDLFLDIDKARRRASKLNDGKPTAPQKNLSSIISLEELQKRIQALKSKQNAEFETQYKVEHIYNIRTQGMFKIYNMNIISL